MTYRNTMRGFAAGTALLALLRVIVKVLFVDTESGFYLGARPLTAAFTVLFLLTAGGIVFTVWKTPDNGMGPLRGNRVTEGAAAICGVLIAGCSVSPLMDAAALEAGVPLINELPRWFQLIEHTMGLVSGAALVVLAFWCISGARRSAVQGVLALTLVVWQSFYTIDRFFGFWQVLTVSDQLLETLFMVCSLGFWSAHAGCLSGIGARRKRSVLWALGTALTGLVLTAGQLAALSVLGSDISGPPYVRLAVIAAVSVYAVLFAACVVRTPDTAKEEPKFE